MTLRLAACLSGSAKAVVSPAYQAHLLASFAPLLEPTPSHHRLRLDWLLHLDGGGADADGNASASTIPGYLTLATKLGAAELRTYDDRSALPRRALPAGQSWCHPRPGAAHNNCSCFTTGYTQALKWRGCLESIERIEAARGAAYDWVLRLRPDIELGARVPSADEFRRLRTDTVWTLVVGTTPRWRGSPLVHLNDTDFVDDALALLPRAIAPFYLRLGDVYEACVPTVAPARARQAPAGRGTPLPPAGPATRGCSGRWHWAECRVLQALEAAMSALGTDVYVGRFPAAAANFSLVDCEPAKARTCVASRRRTSYSNAWSHAQPEQPFLTTGLAASHFPSVALQSTS